MRRTKQNRRHKISSFIVGLFCACAGIVTAVSSSAQEPETTASYNAFVSYTQRRVPVDSLFQKSAASPAQFHARVHLARKGMQIIQRELGDPVAQLEGINMLYNFGMRSDKAKEGLIELMGPENLIDDLNTFLEKGSGLCGDVALAKAETAAQLFGAENVHILHVLRYDPALDKYERHAVTEVSLQTPEGKKSYILDTQMQPDGKENRMMVPSGDVLLSLLHRSRIVEADDYFSPDGDPFLHTYLAARSKASGLPYALKPNYFAERWGWNDEGRPHHQWPMSPYAVPYSQPASHGAPHPEGSLGKTIGAFPLLQKSPETFLKLLKIAEEMNPQMPLHYYRSFEKLINMPPRPAHSPTGRDSRATDTLENK